MIHCTSPRHTLDIWAHSKRERKRERESEWEW
jgi:hypothetical protein